MAYLADPLSVLLHDRLFSLLKRLPLGVYVFAGLIGFFAPYTASISPLVSAVVALSTRLVALTYDLDLTIDPVIYMVSFLRQVSTLTQEECTVHMSDLPWLRNPFNSVHAIALTNLGELASGLVSL